LRTRKCQDKEGKDQYSTEIVAREMQMLGSRGGAGGPPEGRAERRPAAASGEERVSAPAAADEGPFDDDIPF
jgi:single-strand DNA-binding protein